MKPIKKEQFEEFGNPAAYDENRLYHIFAEHGQEDFYYLLVFYGLQHDEHIDMPLNPKLSALLSKVIKHQQKRIRNISKFIYSMKPPGLWLDLGCGVGQFMNKIIQLKGHDVIGTEITINVLRKTHCLLSRANHQKIKLICQDTLELPFQENAFDYILSADVFEHVGYYKQRKIASEMHRVLKNGGQAIVHTPNLNRAMMTTFLKKVYYLFKGINPSNIRHSFPKDHISLTTSKRLSKICQSVGFKTEIYYQIDWKLYSRHKWAFLGIDRLFSRSFILVLLKTQ
jgi:ubiquinone/menaquinone biosynthesis C-methylase UbiE